jgi:two-component system, sensor histidine kinase and response regulator
MESDKIKTQILIAEDSKTQAEQLRYLLEENGYSVKIAENGIRAIKLLDEFTPSLIISDIVMPEMDGYELCSAVKSNPDTKKIPFILLTTLSDPKDIIRGLQSGADNFVSKPYNEEFLLSRISYIMLNRELRSKMSASDLNLEISFNEEKYVINSDRLQMLDLLLSTYSGAVQKNEELIKSNRKLIETYAELDRKNIELEKAVAEKDKFFSIIAHDLKKHFKGFLKMTKIMAEDIQDLSMKKVKETSIEMQIQAKNLYKLLENLLEWTQLQKGNISFKPEELNLYDIVKENIELLNQIAIPKKIDILNEIPETQFIYADLNMINTVLRNLISNAVKYTDKEGKVFIKANTGVDAKLVISIADNGVGIAPDDLQKIFKLDQKASTPGTEGEQGTGLGLLLCKEFVEKNGGSIRVESNLNQGSIFVFSLPLTM